MLVRRLGWSIIAAHPGAWRVEQGHRFAIVIMRMFFHMFVAEVAAFILFVETFDTQPFCRLAAFLADCFRHWLRASSAMGCLVVGLPSRNPTTLMSVSEVVPKSYRWRSTRPVFKYRIGFARLADIHTAPAANRELAQVTAAFQPDGAQVFI